MRPLLTVAMVVVAALAGCTSSDRPTSDDVAVGATAPAPAATSTAPTPSRAAPSNAAPTATTPVPTAGSPVPTPARVVQAAWDDGGLELVLPLEVVLVGFSASAADALAQAFAEPYGPGQSTLHAHETVDPEPVTLGGGYSESDLPLHQAFQVRVVRAPEGDVAAYRAAVARPDAWDAAAAQAWADARLPTWGTTPGLPALVLVHAGTAGHSYAIEYENGRWEDARVVGGDGRALVMDLSADVDPYTGDAKPYMSPLAPTDGEPLVEAVQDAIRFRLLQGPLYPISTAPCHAVTLLYAVHAAGDLGVVADIAADEAFDPAAVEAALQELTGEEVFVDPVRLDLPQDDPALWALVRGVAGGIVWVSGVNPMAISSLYVQGLVRAWVEANWETYHVPHEGCEEYLSLLVYGDALDLGGAFGIAQYDEGDSHRYSFSLVPEMFRSMYEPGPAGGLLCCSPDYVEAFDMVNMLFAHETGHLFGQAHPHNVLDDEEAEVVWSFSTTRTVMSYLVDEMDVSFGTIDQWNWARNRLGYLADALDAAGLREEAVAAGFLDRVEEGDFAGAAVVAQGVLGAA